MKKTINSINKKQNFIQRIFGVAVLTVDSGSANMGHLPEIIVIEKNDVVDQLLNKLKNIDKAKIDPEKQEVIQEDCLYNYSKGKKFIYSLINLVETAIYVFISLVLVGAIVNFILSYLKLNFIPRLSI